MKNTYFLARLIVATIYHISLTGAVKLLLFAFEVLAKKGCLLRISGRLVFLMSCIMSGSMSLDSF